MKLCKVTARLLLTGDRIDNRFYNLPGKVLLPGLFMSINWKILEESKIYKKFDGHSLLR